MSDAPAWKVDKDGVYAASQPALLPLIVDQVPPALRQRPNWVGWVLRPERGKVRLTKVPVALNHIESRSGEQTVSYAEAKSDDRRTWVGWEKVTGELASSRAPLLAGIGFMFGPGKESDGFIGIDLDKCRKPDTGELSAQARDAVAKLPGYWEVSPSGTGIKGFFAGALPRGWKRCRAALPDGQEVEVYSHGRFFTVTGQRVGGSAGDVAALPGEFAALLAQWFPEKKGKSAKSAGQSGPGPARPLDVALAEMFANTKNGANIRALYDGDTSAYDGDESRADEALCFHLAFWLDKDAAAVETAFSASALGQRDKWRERPDYRQRTIARALEMSTLRRGARSAASSGPAAQRSEENGQSQETRATDGALFPLPESGESWNDPYRLARLFVDRHRTKAGDKTLVLWRDEFHHWRAGWRRFADGDLDASLAAHCRDVFVSDMPFRRDAALEEVAGTEKAPKPVMLFPVTRTVRNDARVNLAGQVNHPDAGQDAPFWLWGEPSRDPAEVIAAPNGLFTLGDVAACRGPFEPPSPRFFTYNTLPFPVPASEPEIPRVWLRCLDQWFGNNPASVVALQEWMGLCLSADTSAHKLLFLVGPPRSGKGTVLHVLTELIGAANVASTTFAALGENFGLESLVGKSVAIIPDARLSGRTDVAGVVERLLSISGEDAQTINRKNRPRITTRLRVRFILASNEVPRLQDASGALASRFEIIGFPNSFLGREDRDLKAKLAAELPAILAWAARGYVRLRSQGMAFTQTTTAAEYHRELEELSSPVRAFVRERCDIGPSCEVLVNELFSSWKEWNEQRNRGPGPENMFGRDLRAAHPHITLTQPRRDGVRVRVYRGIGLRPRDDWGEDSAARVGTRARPTYAEPGLWSDGEAA